MEPSRDLRVGGEKGLNPVLRCFNLSWKFGFKQVKFCLTCKFKHCSYRFVQSLSSSTRRLCMEHVKDIILACWWRALIDQTTSPNRQSTRAELWPGWECCPGSSHSFVLNVCFLFCLCFCLFCLFFVCPRLRPGPRNEMLKAEKANQSKFGTESRLTRVQELKQAPGLKPITLRFGILISFSNVQWMWMFF